MGVRLGLGSADVETSETEVVGRDELRKREVGPAGVVGGGC